MESFIYRLASMGLRFSCPLLILAVSTPAMMGKYYLFSAYFTFVVFLIALELAIPYSRRYLRRDQPAWRRRVFSSFVVSQLGLSVALAVPVCVVYFVGSEAAPSLVLLFALVVISETCINEVGRFFWNIGQARIASRRDLVRSVVFVSAVTAAVVIDQEVVSRVSLGIIFVCNVLILVYELHSWGTGADILVTLLHSRWASARHMVRRIVRAVGESLPQVIHMQVLAVQPLLERALIESRIGVEMVGAYSFQYSVIQAATSLFLLPLIATTRRAILGAGSPSDWVQAHDLSIKLLLKVLLTCTLMATMAHFAIPLMAVVLGKSVSSSILVLIAALLAASAATFSAAVSPLYARRGRLLRANSVAFANLLPMVLVLVADESQSFGTASVMTAIMLTAAMQMIFRLSYLVRGVGVAGKLLRH